MNKTKQKFSVLLLIVLIGVLFLIHNSRFGYRPHQNNNILELSELEQIPSWVNPQSLRKLITFYLITDDGFLYYIILGIRNVDDQQNVNSFIYFSEIQPDLEVFRYYEKFSDSFKKVSNSFIQGENSFQTNTDNMQINRNLLLNLNNKGSNIQLDIDMIQSTYETPIIQTSTNMVKELLSPLFKDHFFSSYDVKCPKGGFTGKININGSEKSVKGMAYLDSWTINKSVSRGNWDWGVTHAGKYVLIHFKTYQKNKIKNNAAVYLIWKDKKFYIRDNPRLDYIDFDEKEGFLKINYKNTDFTVQQKIDIRKQPQGYDNTWLAPYTIKINDNGEITDTEGKAIIEKKRPW